MSNVSDRELVDYLETFHETYRDAVESKVPEHLRSELGRYPWMSTGMIGYVSTQFGAGYEYAGSEGDLEIRRGSRRVEELLFDAPPAVRRGPAMISIGGRSCGISHLTLDGAFPVRLTTTESSVTLQDMRAVIGPWTRDVDYAELFGDRTSAFWSLEAATGRALNEVLTAVVDAHEMDRRGLDIEAYLDRFKQKKVLLLGDFSGGRDRLDAIARSLERLGYLPVFADDIPDVQSHDLSQKIMMLALTSRFVLVDDSSKSGQLTEIALLQQVRPVTVILRASGTTSSFMARGGSITSSVVLEKEYQPSTIDSVVTESVQWAEQRLGDLGRELDELYPWRRIDDDTSATETVTPD